MVFKSWIFYSLAVVWGQTFIFFLVVASPGLCSFACLLQGKQTDLSKWFWESEEVTRREGARLVVGTHGVAGRSSSITYLVSLREALSYHN